MVSSLWLGVMGSLLVSVLGVLVAMWLFNRGNRLAEDRTDRLLEELKKMAEGKNEDTEQTEEEKKAFKEFWIGVADIFIARMKEIDGKTAGGMLGPKSTEAKGLLDALDKIQTSAKEGNFKIGDIFGGGVI